MRILALRPRPLHPGRDRRTGFLSSMRGQGHPPHLLVQRAFPAGMPGLCHRLLTGTPIHTRGKSPSHQVGAGGSRSPWKRKRPEGLRWAARAGWGWTPGSPPEQDALAPSSTPCPDTGLGHKGQPCPQLLARLTTCDQVPKMPVSSEGPVLEPPEYTQVGLPFTPKYPEVGVTGQQGDMQPASRAVPTLPETGRKVAPLWGVLGGGWAPCRCQVGRWVL